MSLYSALGITRKRSTHLQLVLELSATGEHEPGAVALVVRNEELCRKLCHLTYSNNRYMKTARQASRGGKWINTSTGPFGTKPIACWCTVPALLHEVITPKWAWQEEGDLRNESGADMVGFQADNPSPFQASHRSCANIVILQQYRQASLGFRGAGVQNDVLRPAFVPARQHCCRCTAVVGKLSGIPEYCTRIPRHSRTTTTTTVACFAPRAVGLRKLPCSPSGRSYDASLDADERNAEQTAHLGRASWEGPR